MSKGYLCKDYQPAQTPEQELALVNRHTRRTLSAEEVFLFASVLCDDGFSAASRLSFANTGAPL